MPVELPLQHALLEVTAPKKETVSSRLSLEEEIDQFQLKEEKEEKGAPVIPILDAEDKFDRFSGVRTLGLVVAHEVNSSEKEEEEMALNLRKGLRNLMARRNKGSSSQEVLKN